MPRADTACLFVADARFYVHQADVTLNQANPVSGTQYAVLPATTFVRIIAGYAVVTWTVQPSPLELHATLDGITIDHQFVNPVSLQPYNLEDYYASRVITAQYLAVAVRSRPFYYETTAGSVTAETTGGTVQNLSASIIYARFV